MRPFKRADPAEKVVLHSSVRNEKLVYRVFPGPRGTDVKLRVAIERAAYADLIAHAKESLEVEVCGVLVGHVCEDDEGRFVHVEALIRGSAAEHKSTQVTFTQATWEAIHSTLERDFPKAKIVGWYHTHPGFGVVFSEMDLFIQKNFFAGPGQIALVTDPLNGAVAIVVNSDAGIEYLPKFWVDSREQLAKVPGADAQIEARPQSGSESGNRDLAAAVEALEARLSQLIQIHDEQRIASQRFIYLIGFTMCFCVIGAVGYLVYNSVYGSKLEPPRLNSFVPVPIQVGEKSVLVGVGVVQWDVPPELNSTLLQIAKADREQALKLKALGTAEKVEPSPVPSQNK